jgi:hypothetical protein
MEGHGRLFKRLSTLGRTRLVVGDGTAFAVQIGLRIFLQNQLGSPLDQIRQRAQPGKPAPEGDVAQLAAVVVVGVTQRNPLFPDGFTVGDLTIGRLAGQVVQGFGEEILFDEPLVRQGEGRIFREDRMTVAATETHAPGRYDFDDELVELRIEHADAELPPGAVVLGEGRGKRQQGQAARRQRNVLFTTAWLYSLTSRRASLMLVLLL